MTPGAGRLFIKAYTTLASTQILPIAGATCSLGKRIFAITGLLAHLQWGGFLLTFRGTIAYASALHRIHRVMGILSPAFLPLKLARSHLPKPRTALASCLLGFFCHDCIVIWTCSFQGLLVVLSHEWGRLQKDFRVVLIASKGFPRLFSTEDCLRCFVGILLPRHPLVWLSLLLSAFLTGQVQMWRSGRWMWPFMLSIRLWTPLSGLWGWRQPLSPS